MPEKKRRFLDDFGVAMFLDAQNISSITKPQTYGLVNLAQNLGDVGHKAVYLDKQHFAPGGDRFFHSLGFKVFNIPGSKSQKNLADQELIKDCLQYIEEHPQTEIILLGSHDKDFAGLIKELQGQGKQVIVVGVSSQKPQVSKKLISLADRVVYLDELEKAFSFPKAA